MYHLAKRVAKRANVLLEPLEMGSRSKPVVPEPVLIVGPPRSGTTLLFQLMVQQLEVAYLSNAHHALFGAPVIIERLVPRRLRRPPHTHESRHGVSAGIWAPSEGGNFWYRFFPLHPHAVQPSEFSLAARRRLRIAIGALSRAAGRPLVSKNVVCSVRLEAISSAVPEMRYIVMHRDHLELASSILAARRQANGNYDDWWSVEPEDIDELRLLPPEEQVVEQVRSVERSIEAARRTIGVGRFIDVEYVTLTDRPAHEVARLGSSLDIESHDGATPLPASFPRRTGHSLEPDLAARLKDYLWK
jgi:hypothetical protein